ncbi:MAG TPA: carboxypeptidase regulatory-like domain-containing protein [Candidatus Acidoferrales bacterium]|nr:carboxypeptidase regulatory-like domain-containing protein [Candidatus Acidoferrales bacterium]
MRDASRVLISKSARLWLLLSLFCAAPAFGSGAGADLPQQSVSQQRLPGQSASKNAALQGVVRDANAKPVIGASVIMRNLATDQKIEKISNAQGVFRFIDVAPGDYELKIVAPDFQDFSNPAIQLKSGDDLVREITLTALPSVAPTQPQFPRLPAVITNPPTESEPAPSSGIPPRAAQTGNLQQIGQQPAPESVPSADQVFHPEPDRWSIAMPDWDRYGIGGEHPYVKGSRWDPFNRNKLKGDMPVIGKQTFLILTATSDTFLDGRRLPTPTDVSSARPGSSDFFGKGNQIFLDQTFAFSFDLFHGDTSFRPVDWRIRITPVVSLNYLDVQELGVVNVDVRKGTTRLDSHLGLQEAFAEVKLHDLGPNYDFVSVRAGIQAFNSDFRGFLFVEEQPGVRLFGNLDSNRWQYNVAYFNFLEKNTNSGLNSMALRNQQVIIANAYRQDFLFPGYTAQLSVHYNKDDASIHYDDNGFLVRPAPIGAVFSSGTVRPHSVHAAYLGWTGDGHIGPLNLTHAFYQAFGNDSFNAIAGKAVTINAQMAALELSYDKDWFRIKSSVFYASGSANPSSSRARGFDSIDDFPEFAGGIFSLWNRESIRLTGSGVALNPGDSLLPDLRSNKDEGQANFVNPGIFLANIGAEFDLTPKLRGFANVNYLRFEHTETLEQILFQSPIHHSIGVDSSFGVRYRPPLTENISIAAGAAALIPDQGLRDIYTGRVLFSLFTDLRFQF